jgi:hypothetical protein
MAIMMIMLTHVIFKLRNYVNAATAASQNLTFASANSFVVRADSKTVLNPSGPGRQALRQSCAKIKLLFFQR